MLPSTLGRGFRKEGSEHTLTGPSGRRFRLRKRLAKQMPKKLRERQNRDTKGLLLRIKAQRKSPFHQEMIRRLPKGLVGGGGFGGELALSGGRGLDLERGEQKAQRGPSQL